MRSFLCEGLEVVKAIQIHAGGYVIENTTFMFNKRFQAIEGTLTGFTVVHIEK